MNNRPNLTINHIPYITMDQQNNEYAERIASPQRRVLRQSTIPTNIVHMDQYSYQNNMNLLPPPSPDQHISPQYSPYNTDTEDMLDSSSPDLRQVRYPIRRQSTLPSRSTEQYYLQQQQQQLTQQPKFLPISPNRSYSRSSEKFDTNKSMRDLVSRMMLFEMIICVQFHAE